MPKMRNRFWNNEPSNLGRREFLRICTAVAATLGLPVSAAADIAKAAKSKGRPSVIWLHFQECTGCSETLLRSSHPPIGELLLDLISLDYHETLLAAAGHQAEEALEQALNGTFICVVEGAIPTKDGGIYCKIGDQTALDLLRRVTDRAKAVIAVGSCASFGGIAAADPNPTGAAGVPQVLPKKSVVSLPGCPPHPNNLLSTVLYYLTFKRLPELDALGRPRFAYGRLIHEHCPRRAHFDAGRFAERFGDESHRQGYCLYKLGCKGPQTHASCSTQHFCDVPGAWPIGIGHPCVGCTEKEVAFRAPLAAMASIERPTPPDSFPSTKPQSKSISPLATGLAGFVGGALAGAGFAFSRKLSKSDPPSSEHEEE